MAAVSLNLFKEHVHADSLIDEDCLLQMYLDAATQQVLDYIGYTEDEIDVLPSIPTPLVQAILLQAGTMYRFRGNVDASNLSALPYSTAAIVKPYCKMRGGSITEKLIENETEG